MPFGLQLTFYFALLYYICDFFKTAYGVIRKIIITVCFLSVIEPYSFQPEIFRTYYVCIHRVTDHNDFGGSYGIKGAVAGKEKFLGRLLKAYILRGENSREIFAEAADGETMLLPFTGSVACTVNGIFF